LIPPTFYLKNLFIFPKDLAKNKGDRAAVVGRWMFCQWETPKLGQRQLLEIAPSLANLENYERSHLKTNP
jgi:hypothetical protein